MNYLLVYGNENLYSSRSIDYLLTPTTCHRDPPPGAVAIPASPVKSRDYLVTRSQ